MHVRVVTKWILNGSRHARHCYTERAGESIRFRSLLAYLMNRTTLQNKWNMRLLSQCLPTEHTLNQLFLAAFPLFSRFLSFLDLICFVRISFVVF